MTCQDPRSRLAARSRPTICLQRVPLGQKSTTEGATTHRPGRHLGLSETRQDRLIFRRGKCTVRRERGCDEGDYHVGKGHWGRYSGRKIRGNVVARAWEAQFCTSSSLEPRGSLYTIHAREFVECGSGTRDVHPLLFTVVYEASKQPKQTRRLSWTLRRVVLPLRFRSGCTAIAVTDGMLQHDTSKLLSDRTYAGQDATPPVQHS
jgi:hypothetical protein